MHKLERRPSDSFGGNVGFRVVCEFRPPQITNSIGMKLARIPAGKFVMGSPADEPGRQANEGPRHDVTITKPFFVGVHEVTVGDFRQFVKATSYVTEAEKSGEGAQVTGTGKNDPKLNWQNPGWEQSDAHALTAVSWNDALAFCRWLSQKEGKSYRLPTEAEWEYCCRAGSQSA